MIIKSKCSKCHKDMLIEILKFKTKTNKIKICDDCMTLLDFGDINSKIELKVFGEKIKKEVLEENTSKRTKM